MHRETVLFIFLWAVAFSNASLDDDNGIEARGKKKKIALFVYFADLIIKKIFVLKLIYAFVFWVILHKAGYFLGWFASYLKEKKQEFHHESPPHHHHFDYGPSQSYGPPQSYGPSQSYGPPQSYSTSQSYDSYDPYKRRGHSFK